ncbi:NUDIX hydrolase [Paenibacillus sp. HB172176]|uniref:NUDIX domain-containing protein n=1 Tax=Paenibacillus sp. HB172176 TaxID=2493690 RepID=UPI001439AAE2|nr:NUDIX hydrolase [Paenibacillus sp. HB172176]
MEIEFAYGGIVFNNAGQVLMRSPLGQWGGYVWTFAKGGTDINDRSPEDTALREVKEETGYECKILKAIPGEFKSETCVTKYYLMQPINDQSEFDKETQEVKWVTIEEAFELIKMTKTIIGRERDKNALITALNTKKNL